MVVERKYKCNNCGFEWNNPNKQYEKCPECKAEDIVDYNEEQQRKIPQQRSGGGGRGGMRAGIPRVCKCHLCGYETQKIQGIPCRNDKCPKCGTPLCGSE